MASLTSLALAIPGVTAGAPLKLVWAKGGGGIGDLLSPVLQPGLH